MTMMQRKHIDLKDRRGVAEYMKHFMTRENRLQQVLIKYRPNKLQALEDNSAISEGNRFYTNKDHLSNTIDQGQINSNNSKFVHYESFVQAQRPKLLLPKIKSKDLNNIVGKKLVKVIPFLRNGKIEIKQ